MDTLSIARDIIIYIRNLFETPEFIETHRVLGHFVRKRKLSILQVIIYLFYTYASKHFQHRCPNCLN